MLNLEIVFIYFLSIIYALKFFYFLYNMIQYIPNTLSISRPFLAILIIILLSQGLLLWSFISCILAGLTDIYDGMVARDYKVTSSLGSVLDPVMDKLFVLMLSAFLFINYDKEKAVWIIILLTSWVIMVWIRNVSQLLSVPILKIAKRSFKVDPKPFAKWGTIFNFIVLASLIFFEMIQKFYSLNTLLEGNKIFNTLNIPLTLVVNFVYNYTHFTLLLLLVCSLFFELFIFITFFPRFIQILQGRHDTFH